MSVEAVPRPRSARAVPAAGRPEWVVLRITARRAVRSALLWGAVAGLYLELGTDLVLTALAVLAAALGTVAFVRRDLAGE